MKGRAGKLLILGCCLVACARESDRELSAEADQGGRTPEPEAETTRTTAPPEPLELLWSTEGVHFVSRPTLSGGNLVAYAVEGRNLTLRAYDPETGVAVWQRPSSASRITDGVAFSIRGDADRIFHMVRGEGGGTVIEAVDAATGEPVWTSPLASEGFHDQLDYCDLSEDALCVTAGDGAIWQIDVETGQRIEPSDLQSNLRAFPGSARVPPPGSDGGTQQPVDGRALGDDIYDLFASGDIARIVDGEIIWQRSPSELFRGEDVSPDYGWWFRVEGPTLVGWLGAEVDQVDDGQVELTVQHIAGIDYATGETRWVTEGSLACGFLSNLALWAARDEPWLRCHTVGTMTMADGEPVGYDLDNVLEEFDPETGETVWSFDLGPSSALWDDDRILVRLGRERFGLVRDDGTLVGLDIGTGEEVEVGPDDVGWCFGLNIYDYWDGSATTIRVGEDFTTPCRLSGEPQPVPIDADPQMGLQVGDVFVWMDEAGLHGARIAR